MSDFWRYIVFTFTFTPFPNTLFWGILHLKMGLWSKIAVTCHLILLQLLWKQTDIVLRKLCNILRTFKKFPILKKVKYFENTILWNEVSTHMWAISLDWRSNHMWGCAASVSDLLHQYVLSIMPQLGVVVMYSKLSDLQININKIS